MPRPTPAQFAYGSVTVICSTLAMLLLSGSPSGAGVAVIAVAALALGVLVALTAPRASGAAPTRPDRLRAPVRSRVHATHRPASAEAARTGQPSRRLAEPSLRH